ncbi:unnamed protein product [Rotaria magnacalcarata]
MAETIEAAIICEHCNTQIKLQDQAKHSRRCSNTRKKRIERKEKVIVNDELDDEKIPCEFCNDRISLDHWSSHSATCADLHRRRIENLRNGIDNEPIDALIPCEYCDKQVHANDIESHTKQCTDKYRRRREEAHNDDIDLIPCEYCHVPISTLELEWHTSECVEVEQRRMNDLAIYPEIDPSNERIPCQFCDQCFPVEQIETHQKRCRHEQRSSNSEQNILHDQAFGDIFSLPQHWDPSSLNNLSRHLLDPRTEEYKFIADKFHSTLPSNRIVRIERIQNRRWYRQYDAHKEDFIERYGNSTEQWLFHGELYSSLLMLLSTVNWLGCRQSESAEAIIHDCFNRSHAVNSVGQGIYFATQALISHGYTQPDTHKLRHMFMARVLVGKTTTGNPSTRVCPRGYDTTGGNNVFVTYHDAQAYGEYLIVYK